VLVWLSVWSEVQIVCMWSTASQKPYRLLLHLNPDWFYLSGNQLTQVVLEKRPLNGCSSSSSSIDFLLLFLLLLLLKGATAMLLRCCRFRASRVASTTVTPSSPTSAAMLSDSQQFCVDHTVSLHCWSLTTTAAWTKQSQFSHTATFWHENIQPSRRSVCHSKDSINNFSSSGASRIATQEASTYIFPAATTVLQTFSLLFFLKALRIMITIWVCCVSVFFSSVCFYVSKCLTK